MLYFFFSKMHTMYYLRTYSSTSRPIGIGTIYYGRTIGRYVGTISSKIHLFSFQRFWHTAVIYIFLVDNARRGIFFNVINDVVICLHLSHIQAALCSIISVRPSNISILVTNPEIRLLPGAQQRSRISKCRLLLPSAVSMGMPPADDILLSRLTARKSPPLSPTKRHINCVNSSVSVPG